MQSIKFDPVAEEEIPRRGKYREQVKRWLERFLKSENRVLKSNEFNDKRLAMSYYDSFKDHVKRNNLPVQVRIRQNDNGTAWNLFLFKPEVLSQK